jgi:hypothetical protein
LVVTPRPDTIDQLVFDASPPRSPGLHLSTIIKSICHEIDPKRFPLAAADGGGLPWNRFEVGFTFERVLETAFASRRLDIFRPGEITLDGIAMSPDGIDPDGWILEEFKSTWMTSHDVPEGAKCWHWKIQMMAYCHALGTTRARLRALFINGNGDKNPEYKVWDLEFTEQELEANWTMIVRHARAKGWLPNCSTQGQ